MRGVPKIPYFQTSRYRVDAMVELAEPLPGEKVADLGTGDGRITIAFARTGAEVYGYEIDETLRKLAEENIKNGKLKNAIIHNIDFWTQNLSKYDIIACYPMPTIIDKLEKKLMNELRPGSRILLNYFPFCNWKAKKIKDNIFLYVK